MSFVNRIKDALFPIKKEELNLFLPMVAIIFAVLYNYTVLRNMKDTLVVNAAGAGVITFLKLYFVTPLAILSVLAYTKISNSFGREGAFYIIVSFFVSFFLVFAFVIYPNLEFFHPSVATVAHLKASYPRLAPIVDIYAYWSFSIFFALAEIWGSIALSTLFWQFANQVIKIDISKRFYPLFIILGNFSLIAAGNFASYLNIKGSSIYSIEADKWFFSMKYQLLSVAAFGVIAMLAYRYVNILTSKAEKAAEESQPKKEKKAKPGVLDSFKILLQSRHLQLIAALVICYGVSVNLVEVQWKNQVKTFFSGDKAAFNAFMNTYSKWTGIFSILFGWIAGTGILRKLSWSAAASITPLIMLVGGAIFFITILSGNVLSALIGLDPVFVSVMLGAGIVIATKVVKYSLFDSTKEMAYIPLPDEEKGKGKPAVEVFGGRLGKSGGAFIQSTMLIALAVSNVVSIAPYSFVFFLIAVGLWLFAVKVLGKRITDISTKK